MVWDVLGFIHVIEFFLELVLLYASISTGSELFSGFVIALWGGLEVGGCRKKLSVGESNLSSWSQIESQT